MRQAKHAREQERARFWLDIEHDEGLDAAHAAVWEGIRGLFPADAMADQAAAGLLLVSWPLRRARRSDCFAAPILLRIDSGLLLALWASDAEERIGIARAQRSRVQAALGRYDPKSRIPTLPVIVLGDELAS